MGGIVIQTFFGHGIQSSYTSELCFIHLHRQEVLGNDDEVKALKSFIRAESLTSPQHPFYDPKAEGVEMFMGKYHKLEHATTLSLGRRNLARRRITSSVLLKAGRIPAVLDESYGTGRSAHPAAFLRLPFDPRHSLYCLACLLQKWKRTQEHPKGQNDF
jgi:hypothetical protein